MFQLYLHTTSKPKVGMRSMLPNFGSTISLVNYPTLKEANSASCERVGWGSSSTIFN